MRIRVRGHAEAVMRNIHSHEYQQIQLFMGLPPQIS